MSQDDKKRFIINVAFCVAILGIAWFVINYLFAWLMPFVVGFVLALIMQPVINLILRHTRLRRKVVAPGVTLVLLVILATVVTLLAARVGSELVSFITLLPQWFNETSPAIIDAINIRFEDLIAAMPNEWEESLREMTYQFIAMVQSELGRWSGLAVSWLANKATVIPGVLISFIITMVATFFICSEFDRISTFFRRQVPEQYKGIAGDTAVTFGHTVGQMLSSYLLIMFITFCELSISLALQGIEYWLVLAALISLVDILPVLGTGTILIPWGLAALLLGDVKGGLSILLTYVVITVVRNILEPRIIGNRIGVHPLVTLIFMYLGLNIMGILGMFLFPLVFVLLKNAQEVGMIKLWK